jgi:HK97 family phage portal protein
MKIIKQGKQGDSDITTKSVDWLYMIDRDSLGLSEGYLNYELATKGFTSIIYACITLIARTIAQNEFKLYKDGKLIELDSDDFLAKLLRNPNPYMTWFDFVYLLQVMQEIYGERYIYLARDKIGITRQLWVIPSYNIEPVFDEKTNSKIIGYSIISDEDKNVNFKPNEIVYDFIPSSININRGESPLSKILLERDIHIFAKTYVKNFYRNGAIPFGILIKRDGRLTRDAIEEIKRAWDMKHKGVEKSWNIAVLNGDFDYKEISVKPSDDFIKQSKWTVYDILAVFNVPPLKLGYTEGVNRTTAKEQNLIFARDCIKPRLIKLQSLFNDKLFPAMGFSNYRIEFASPIPQDMELNVQRAKVGATFGVLTVNEIRELLGFEKLDDEIGEQIVEPLNLPQGRKPKNEEDATKLVDEK